MMMMMIIVEYNKILLVQGQEIETGHAQFVVKLKLGIIKYLD